MIHFDPSQNITHMLGEMRFQDPNLSEFTISMLACGKTLITT